MYPFWDGVIEPVLVAAGAARVVEIGALRGETTVHLLDLLGPDAMLHVIDPVPMFDPTEHERRFAGRYVFHRDISHNVLPGLEPMDAALIDGDHNWYTVYNELRMLRDVARRAGEPMPLLVMHDVLWPYGRRDLYYTPDRVPEEFRQAHRPGGLFPDRAESARPGGGGLNPHLANAINEGGPRNGVMTALDDFRTEHDRPLRTVVLPLYFGLAIVAEQDRLDASPALRAMLDDLESSERRLELIELGESIRVREQVEHHNVYFGTQARFERSARRYLELFKSAILDEHHIDNELRIDHLLSCIDVGVPASELKVADPTRYMPEELEHLQRLRRTGTLSDRLAATAVGRNGLDRLERCLDVIRGEMVDGDLVDCGVGAGGTSVFLRGYLDAFELGRPAVWVADRFDGADGPANLNTVRELFQRFGLLDARVTFLQGPPAEMLTTAPIDKVALLRVAPPGPAGIAGSLAALYDNVTLGGFVVVDGIDTAEGADAVARFRNERGVTDELERVGPRTALWRKTNHGTPATSTTSMTAETAAPLAATTTATATTGAKDLSIVVVAYNMRREAARTLHSLSRSYQEATDHLDYEVIVVENGSAPGQELGAEYVASFGPEFRYLDLGDDARPSPAHALNRGIAAATGNNLALMIDGAHVLTPGVVRYGMLGLSTYRPAVVTTQQWYVGPGQQNEAVAAGYDQAFEDKLFAEIDWPADGYRLFHVGHFIGDRDWFDGQWESNCIFVPRDLLAQVGAFDERFDQPGGAFANLDLFERVASAPGVRLATLLGEGSFHQVHGGTTTNVGEATARGDLIASYYDHYEQLRGRPFSIPAKPFHYVGTMRNAAKRTKARRLGAPAYFSRAHVDGTDGRPERPIPVPDDVRLDFVDAFWRSQAWKQTTWLGKWTAKAPTDLLTYQELLHRVRPRHVIETGTGGGGRALFLASVCEMLGAGEVISIGDYPVPTLPEHPRLTYVRADPLADDAAAEVAALVGEHPRALLILSAAGSSKVLRAFERYAGHVPVGSYVVVEDTIVNGHPVWAGFGSGPAEAVKEIVNAGDFVADTALERYALTFNPGGFLRRTR